MKVQLLRLAEAFNEGKGITRETAYQDYAVQNLTGRITELRALGFEFEKRRVSYFHPGLNHHIKVPVWKLRQTYKVGDRARVKVDQGVYISFQGRIGEVTDLDLGQGKVTLFIDNVGYRQLRWDGLDKVPVLAPGTPVKIMAGPLVVSEYHPGVDSYTLLSPDPKRTIVASAALVEVLRQDSAPCVSC
jgi:ribosomal protein L21E